MLLPSLAHAAPAEIEFSPERMRAAAAGPADASDADADQPTASAAPATPADVVAPAAPPRGRWLEAYGAIAGGVNLQSLHQMPGQQTSSQNPTVAISRLGVRGGIGEHVSFASEFEASLGGPLGYGASVWEGQAALAIRDQFVRYRRAGWSVAAGRIDDPASFDYVSSNLGDLLYADLYTRDPLLYSGADRGNGLFGSYALTEHLTAGLTFHSTNPTGITGTLEIGGKLQPFDRPFYLAAAQVGNSQNSLPDQNLHIYFGSPSLQYKSDRFEAQAEVQMYSLDTQVAVMDDQTIPRLQPAARREGQARRRRKSADPVREHLPQQERDPRSDGLEVPTPGPVQVLHVLDGRGLRDRHAARRRRPVRHGGHPRARPARPGALPERRDDLLGRGRLRGRVRGSVFAQQISGETMTTGSRSVFVTARLVLR